MHLGSVRLYIDRFDRVVVGVLLALGLATGFVLLRGDQVGVQITDPFPVPDSTGVSTRTEIRLTFGEPMDKSAVEGRLRLIPQQEGTSSWRGNTLVWRPLNPLAKDSRYVVALTAGARSERGRLLRDDLRWEFHTGRPRVLYMSVGDISQLYTVQVNGLGAHPLTRFNDGSSVFDYAASPDGTRIAFGLLRPDASAVDLWLMGADGEESRLLLACDQSQCSGVTWSPDGLRLAYERRALNVDLGAVGGGMGPSRVWLLDLDSGRTYPLHSDSQMLGYAPKWAPDGTRLGYFDPQGGVRIMDIETGVTQLFANQLGEMGSWSPDGRTLVLVDLVFFGEGYSSYLLQANLAEGTVQNLSRDPTAASESSPVWSPSGEWIAFGRKALADGTPTAGQQLWLMRPDGSEARPLVTEREAHLGSFAWSPDGRDIAYLRFPLMQADARPSIWLVSLDSGERIKLADSATLPSWLP